MDNYINLAELRQVAESLLYKINTIADTKVDNYNVIVNESNPNADTNYDNDGNYILGSLNGNELKIPYNFINPSLLLTLKNNIITLKYNGGTVSSVTLPVYNGGVSG